MEADHERGLRRKAGIALGIAVAMVLCGLTFLTPYLRGLVYLVYWLVCIVVTFAALLLAFVDLQRLRQQSREQQRDLIKNALHGLPDPSDAGQSQTNPDAGRSSDRQRRQ
jgi:hypothetical protein